MKRYGYAERDAAGWQLRDLLSDGPADAGSIDGAMVSRLDFDARIVDLPAAASKDVDGFLRYRLRSLYPGNPEDTVFDWQPLPSGASGRRALLLITRRETLEGYRAATAGKPLFLPYTLVGPLLQRSRSGPVTVLFHYGAWVEVITRVADGSLAFSATRSAGDADADAARALDAAGGEARAGGWIVVARRGLVEALGEAVGRASAAHAVAAGPAAEGAGGEGGAGVAPVRPRKIALEDLVAGLGPKSLWLFAPRRKPVTISRSVRVQVLAALALVIALGLLRKSVVSEQAYLDALRARTAQLQRAATKTASLAKDIDTMTKQLASLQASASVDVYAALSELAAVLGSDTRVQSFVLDKGTFQIEAIGPGPLALMEQFKGRPSFTNVKLLQTTPVDKPKGQELFRITGNVNVE